MIKIKQYFSNEIVPYMALKYGGLGIQFFATAVIASKLGAYYFGVWSFLLLVKRYLAYSSFGTNFSLNAILAVHGGGGHAMERHRINFFQSSIGLNILFMLLLFVFWCFYFFSDFAVFEKYNLKAYSFYIVIFIFFENINQLYVNLFRIQGRVLRVGFLDLSLGLSHLLPVLFFSGEFLVKGLLISQIVFSALLFFYYISISTIPFRLRFEFGEFLLLFKRGLNLLFYNLSFAFILLSTRSLVSYYFSVEIFGEFGFAVQIAAVAHLGLNTIVFLFFPKFLNKLRKDQDREVVSDNLEKIRVGYLYAHSFISFFIIALCPLVEIVFPEYSNTALYLVPIMLLNVGLAFSNAHSSLMISWGRERILYQNGFATIILNVGLFILFKLLFESLFLSLISCAVSGLFYSLITIGRIVQSTKDVVFKDFWLDLFHILITSGLTVFVFSFRLEASLSFLPLAYFVIFGYRKLWPLVGQFVTLLKSRNALGF